MSSPETNSPPAPALKEMFDAARFRTTARQVSEIYPKFDSKHFLKRSLAGLDELSLMQRLRRMTESLHATLPSDFRKTLGILKKLAPKIDRGFITLVLPDYVGQYGLEDFEASLEALKFFTTFGSAEFAIREFLRRDLSKTLAVMETWSHDKNEHVRRLASEGSRPRLPWSFRLEALITDPSPTFRILENLKADPNLYVRKSVANHLNDITKDHAALVMERLERWPLDNPHTNWIAKQALRTLIKKGDQRALKLVGASGKAEVKVLQLLVQPKEIKLGGKLTLSFQLRSTSSKAQRLIVDYVVHYVKKSGGSSGKVFKLKELSLAAGEVVSLSRSQSIRDFTTRVHHPGRHEVEIMVNGEKLAKDFFQLSRPK